MRVLMVDGHSMIFAWPEMRKLHARRTALARDSLIKQLTDYQDYSGVHVVVVFDGKGVAASETTEPGGIQIFYSGTGQTADDLIERLTASYGNMHEISVATDDYLEQQTVSTFGAVPISAATLREMLDDAARSCARDLKRLNRR